MLRLPWLFLAETGNYAIRGIAGIRHFTCRQAHPASSPVLRFSCSIQLLLLFRQLNRGDSGVDRFIVAEKSHSIDMLGAVADNFRCYNIPGFLSNIGEIKEAGHVGLNQADGVKMKAFELFFSLWRCTAQQHGYRIGTRSADNACRKHENHLPYALSYVEESGEKRQSIAELLRIFAL